MSALVDRLRRGLNHPRFAWFLAAIATVVHLPELTTGFIADDFTHRAFAQGYTVPGGPRGLWDLYRFADGGVGVRKAIDNRLYPWWTSPDLKLAFFRPISSLLRVAEERLFGDHPIFCHAISIALFAITAVAVLHLYRAWIGGAAASLGALLFAIDDAHATTVTWIAARHSLVGTLFVVFALTSFLRAKAANRSSIASGVLFFLGLASSESALSGLAFFGALTLFNDARVIRARVVSLIPVALATIAWAGCYAGLGYGSQGSGFYVDPMRSPFRFLHVAALRAPTLALAQLFLPPSEVSALTPGMATPMAVLGGAFFIVFAAITLRVLPNRSLVLSLLTAFAFAIVPACGTNQDDRLLMVPGIAAFALLALWARYVVSRRRASIALRIATTIGIFVHVAMALVLLPIRARTMASMLGALVDSGAESLPKEPGVEHEQVIGLVAPDGLLAVSMLTKRSLSNEPMPKVLHILTTSPKTPLTVLRKGPSILELRCAGGMMRDPFILALRPTLFAEGEVIELPDEKIEILSVLEGGFPTAIRFTFADGSLDDGSRRFVSWQNHRFVENPLMPVSASVEYPAIDFQTELTTGPLERGRSAVR